MVFNNEASNTTYGISFAGVGAAVPETVITNDDLTQLVDTSDEWITTRTGIRTRHVVKDNETAADLAILAAQEALDSAGESGEDIDLIIAACSTPDTIYPAMCSQIQKAIGATKAAGFDLAMACSGFTLALNTASQFLRNGTYKKALIVASDTHSRYTNWSDRNTCILFGDGAGAAVLTAEANAPDNYLAFDMQLYGEKGNELTMYAPVENCPLVSPYENKSRYVYMNGREVFKFAVNMVPKSITETISKAGLTLDEVDHFVLHQANIRIMEAMSEKLNIPMEKMVINVSRYGNTSAASIPLALNEAALDNRIKPGEKVVLCGFGAGLTWGTIALNWTAVDQRKARDNNAAAILRHPVAAV